VTYGSLRDQIEITAGALRTAGIARGDRVALALPPGLPAVVCSLAAAIAGTAVPLNPACAEAEFRGCLDATGAKLLILPSRGTERARRAAAGCVPIATADLDASGQVWLDRSARHDQAPPPSPDDVALVLHTSGSSGRPKPVPLRHRHVSASVAHIVGSYRLGPDDVSLCVMPLFHAHGFVASLLATLASGGTVVLPPRFTPFGLWRLVREHRVTWFSAAPAVHRLLLVRVSTRVAPPRTLRFIRSSSAALTARSTLAMEAAFGVPVLEAYGMTEACHQISSNPLPPGERKPGTVGMGTGVQVAIIGEDGRHLPAGTTGEVVIQGPNVTDGDDTPEGAAVSFIDGWLRTGDLGVLDHSGCLTLVGRTKDLISRGAEKISPQELDEVLLTHPDVVDAVCFGVAHPVWGEEVAGVVVPRAGATATEADLLAYCREHRAEFACPKQIHLTEAIPRGASGKVNRHLLAAHFAPRSSRPR
jgi:acyl-CoA synthetase (AMP-forming)/AMP-acid ligase II